MSTDTAGEVGREAPAAEGQNAADDEALREMVRYHRDDQHYFRTGGPTPMPEVEAWHRERADVLERTIARLATPPRS